MTGAARSLMESRHGAAGRCYSITSSAATRSVCGMEMAKAFAACRFITSSNLVGSITGSSAGFSPLRMRPVRQIASGPIQTGDEPDPDRVSRNIKDNRNRRCRSLC